LDHKNHLARLSKLHLGGRMSISPDRHELVPLATP
jgi:hypothetical protein